MSAKSRQKQNGLVWKMALIPKRYIQYMRWKWPVLRDVLKCLLIRLLKICRYYSSTRNGCNRLKCPFNGREFHRGHCIFPILYLSPDWSISLLSHYQKRNLLYTYTYNHMHIRFCIHTYTRICIFISICICIRVCLCKCIYKGRGICVYRCISIGM